LPFLLKILLLCSLLSILHQLLLLLFIFTLALFFLHQLQLGLILLAVLSVCFDQGFLSLLASLCFFLDISTLENSLLAKNPVELVILLVAELTEQSLEEAP